MRCLLTTRSSRHILLCLVAAMLSLGSPSIRSIEAEPIIDQQEPIIDFQAPFIFGIGPQILAQTVTAGMTGFLVGINLPVTIGPGTVTIAIEGVSPEQAEQALSGGVPSGPILTAETFSAADMPPVDASGFRDFSFSTPVSLTAGEPFAVVLSAAGQSGIQVGPLGNSYARGEGLFFATDTGHWASISIGTGRFDHPFQTVMEPVPELPTGIMLVTGVAALGIMIRRRHG